MSTSIYYILFIVLFCVTVVSISSQGKKYTLLLLICAVIFLSFFAGLRVGSPDQGSYRNIFYETATLDAVLSGNHNYDKVYGEWGFLFLNTVIKFFTENDTAMFVVLAFFTIGMVAFSCERISPYPVMSIFCYYSWFYYCNFGGLRHALSSSVVLLTAVTLARNYKKSAFLIFLSSVSIHVVSVFAIVLWFSRYIARKRCLLVFLMLTSIVIFSMGGVGMDVVSKVVEFGPAVFKAKLQYYLASDLWGVSEGAVRGVIIKQLLILSMCFFYIAPLKKKFDGFPILFGCYAFSTFFLIIFSDFKVISDRVSQLLSISEIVLIPMLFSLVPREEKNIVFFIVSLGLFYQVHRLVLGGQFYPYKFNLF